MDHRKQEKKASSATAVVIIARLVPAMQAWAYVVTFIHDGIPYDYVFDAGSPAISEEAARTFAERKNFLGRAQALFIEDVALGREHNDMELHAA